jgi:hypothetical protein
VPDRQVIGREFDASLERGERAFEVARSQRTIAARLEHRRAVQRLGEVAHQRIGRSDLDLAPLTQVHFGFVHLAETTISQRQRVVHDRGTPVQ